MTYNVSSGTLNTTIPYHLAISKIFSVEEWPDIEIWVWGSALKMARFDRPCMTFYESAIKTIAQSCTICELFGVEYYRDLEIWLRAHSTSLKLVPFKRLGAVSYSPSIATMTLSL